MIYPDFFNEFSCKAGECEHTCCAGREIDIDSKSADELCDICALHPRFFGEFNSVEYAGAEALRRFSNQIEYCVENVDFLLQICKRS